MRCKTVQGVCLKCWTDCPARLLETWTPQDASMFRIGTAYTRLLLQNVVVVMNALFHKSTKLLLITFRKLETNLISSSSKFQYKQIHSLWKS